MTVYAATRICCLKQTVEWSAEHDRCHCLVAQK